MIQNKYDLHLCLWGTEFDFVSSSMDGLRTYILAYLDLRKEDFDDQNVFLKNSFLSMQIMWIMN